MRIYVRFVERYGGSPVRKGDFMNAILSAKRPVNGRIGATLNHGKFRQIHQVQYKDFYIEGTIFFENILMCGVRLKQSLFIEVLLQCGSVTHDTS